MSRTRGNTPRQYWFVLAIFLAACASDGFDASVQAQAKGGDQGNTIRIYKKVAPATVFIKSVLVNDYLSGGTSSSIGSGIILDRQGLILTNAHVVDKAAKILVILHNGTQLTATLMGSDPITDLALLRVELPKNHHATVLLGNSDRMEIGQEVVAIGHPFGLGYALTTGVVSGFGTTPDPQATPHERVIQTSAAINPGNSGGPLVDKEGQVVGINMAVMAGGQNIGFAIPINTAKTVVNELRAHGRVVRPWLGITGKLVSDHVINLFAFPLAKGLMVAHLDEGSPAQKAGLRAGTLNVVIDGEPWVLGGDIVLAVNGLDISTAERYVAVLKTLDIGQVVTLRLFRNGDYQDITATIEEHPQPQTGSNPTRVQESLGVCLMNRPSGSHESSRLDIGF
jgi:S1-C subfamily serine protease